MSAPIIANGGKENRRRRRKREGETGERERERAKQYTEKELICTAVVTHCYLRRHPLQKSPSTVSPQNRSSLLWRYARAGAEALWAREHCKRAKGIIAVEVVEERENKAAIAELLDCADKAVILSSGCGEGARW